MKPAIIVVTHSRIKSLKRLLSSIENANYLYSGIPLVISIDAGARTNREILKIANEFHWKHGEKRIINHKENLGLRMHILTCGDLSSEYGAVIVLEDDLYVSPYFYTYTCEAIDFYKDDENIAEIALYSYNRNVNANLPFIPLKSAFDTYFMQFPASWGQCWTDKQWTGFRNWYNEKQDILPTDEIPEHVKLWPESSWLKYFTKYIVVKDKYVVYPYCGLSTNFSDTGVHNINSNNAIFQSIFPLSMKVSNFAELTKSETIYDAYYEIKPDTLKKYNPIINKYKFVVDLYGTKKYENYTEEYLLSTKHCSNPLQQFPLLLKPQEQNIILDLHDEKCIISLGDKNSFSKNAPLIDLWNYYNVPLPITISITQIIRRLANILLRR